MVLHRVWEHVWRGSADCVLKPERDVSCSEIEIGPGRAFIIRFGPRHAVRAASAILHACMYISIVANSRIPANAQLYACMYPINAAGWMVDRSDYGYRYILYHTSNQHLSVCMVRITTVSMQSD